MNRYDSDLGKPIRNLRRQRQWKLVALKRYVSPSTLNAIENNRMVPSIAIIDRIAEAYGLPQGAFDLMLLETVRDNAQRSHLVSRLRISDAVKWQEVQRVLRQAQDQASLSPLQRTHARFLLAQELMHRQLWRRATIILRRLLRSNAPPQGAFRVEVLSALGRCHLCAGYPQDALEPLLEAVKLHPINGAWETAMCNLALAWWSLGQYELASHQWRRVIESVKSHERRGHAYLGLGNAAFRATHFDQAIAFYHQALVLYTEGSSTPTAHLRVANNLLASHIRLEDWFEAEAAARFGDSLAERVDPIVWGSWLATKAEWAWALDHVDEARQFNDAAKDAIGSASVTSWFTVRLLELRMGGQSAQNIQTLLQEIGQQMHHLKDRWLAMGLQAAILEVLWENQDLNTLPTQIHALTTMVPVFG